MKGKHIGLALQGGGSYAAFTAGVLKALLNKKRKFLSSDEIHSISGTSGGALNSMLLGLAIHEKQKNPLTYVSKLWEINQIEKLLKENCASLKLVPDEFLTLLVGEYKRLKDMTPRTSAVLAEISKAGAFANEAVNKMVHYAAPSLPKELDVSLLPNQKPYVTVAGTEIKTATAHYFTNNKRMIKKYEKFKIAKRHHVMKALTLQGVYASLSHPSIFKATEIDDGLYWDGYYTSNPPFMYLFREGCDEVILVRLIQQKRETVGQDMISVKDRAEEIIQNNTLNMEILIYLAMREILVNNKEKLNTLKLKMAPRRLSLQTIFHEIRMLKPGHIADEGYPLSSFVERLMKMGEKVVADKNGFVKAYSKAEKGVQVISEINFDNEEVNTHVNYLDELLFEEETED